MPPSVMPAPASFKSQTPSRAAEISVIPSLAVFSSQAIPAKTSAPDDAIAVLSPESFYKEDRIWFPPNFQNCMG
jgi:hypothetical protein